jgi:hypothetical protein
VLPVQPDHMPGGIHSDPVQRLQRCGLRPVRQCDQAALLLPLGGAGRGGERFLRIGVHRRLSGEVRGVGGRGG